MSRLALTTSIVLAFAWSAPLHAECSAPFAEESGSVPASEVARVDIKQHKGTLRVEASSGESARWSVRYCEDGWFGESEDKLKTVRPEVSSAGGRLQVRTEIPFGIDDDDIIPHWTISVPASAQLDLDMGAGEVTVEGIAGGVAIDAAVGDIEVDVPGGALEIDLGVGDARATWGPGDYARADVDAGVGDAELSIGGRDVDVEHAPGPGHRIGLHGANKGPSLRVEVNVGDAQLNIR